MRVLLINPAFQESYWGFHKALPFEGTKAALPPLGLLTVSSLLPTEWEKRLVDLEAKDKLKNSAIKWADIIFITGMLIQKQAIHALAKRCKALGKKVVVGGPYVSTLHDEILEADHIFVGETEAVLPQFITDLKNNTTQRIYKAKERPPLAMTPLPDFSLLGNLKKYSSMSVQYSRGCPFSCEFCDIIEIYGRVPRTKSNQQILAELDTLRELGWRGSVFIVDDNFIGNKKNIRLLLPELVTWQNKHGHPFTFLTEASINLADDADLLDLMKQAGFTKVFIGIETPVPESLAETQKSQNRGDLLEKVAIVQKYGMEVMAGFIVGFDSDPEDVFDIMIEFIQRSAIPLAMVGILSALPDTQLWKRLDREGRLLHEGIGSNTISSMNFIPKMDAEKLVAGYRRIMETVYSSRYYYERSLECIRRMPEGQYVAREYSWLDVVKTLTRIVVKLGILDTDRKEFWRFMSLAWQQRSDRIVQALRLAVMGYNFRRLNEAIL